MRRIIDMIKKYIRVNRVSTCGKCGWETCDTATTDMLKKYCKECN